MTERKEKRGTSPVRPSLDNFMGKALCILLVVILAVGAFLAPKVINNFYDARTLMQITYADMELSPYAVDYVTMEDKLQAIARVKTAGGSLSVLPTGEESSGGISNTELTEAVNREVGELRWDLGTFYSEGWWDMLTEESLVSRKKYTVYGIPDEGEGEASQEMAPFQFWVLQFARMEVYDGKETADKYPVESGYATDRIMVCMDADFYKIYAFAFAGNTNSMAEQYGWVLSDIFDAGYREGYVAKTISEEERQDLRINLTRDLLGGLTEYWDTAPKGQNCYVDTQGGLAGDLIYGEPETYGGAETYRETETPEASVGMDEMDMQKEGETALAVGTQVQAVWGEADFATWVQKTGCMDFFDMMQF